MDKLLQMGFRKIRDDEHYIVLERYSEYITINKGVKTYNLSNYLYVNTQLHAALNDLVREMGWVE